jgi:hypothetical protein
MQKFYGVRMQATDSPNPSHGPQPRCVAKERAQRNGASGLVAAATSRLDRGVCHVVAV